MKTENALSQRWDGRGEECPGSLISEPQDPYFFPEHHLANFTPPVLPAKLSWIKLIASVSDDINIKTHGTGTFTWTGATNASWDEWENWDTHVAPNSLDDVVISRGSVADPMLSQALTANHLVINTGTLDANGYKITLTGGWMDMISKISDLGTF